LQKRYCQWKGPLVTAASLVLIRTVLSFAGKRIAIDRHESINKNEKIKTFYAVISRAMKLNGFFISRLGCIRLIHQILAVYTAGYIYNKIMYT
jgi:hypothetical protein